MLRETHVNTTWGIHVYCREDISLVPSLGVVLIKCRSARKSLNIAQFFNYFKTIIGVITAALGHPKDHT